MVTSCSCQGTSTLYNKKRGVLPVHHLYAFLHNFCEVYSSQMVTASYQATASRNTEYGI